MGTSRVFLRRRIRPRRDRCAVSLLGLLIGIGMLASPRIEAAAEPVNLTRLSGAIATQSSTAYNGSAANAIDGVTDGNFSARSVTHTGDQAGAWWQVTLRKPATVKSIVLWNRTDCCADRLSNIRVNLLDDDGLEVWGADFGPDTAGGDPAAARRFIIDLPEPTKGSVVKIAFIDGAPRPQNYLSLAEVQVLGEELPEAVPRIVEQRTTTVLLSTVQRVKHVYDNPTDNPRRIRNVLETKESFNSKSAVESIKEETRSSSFNIEGSITTSGSGSFKKGPASGSASVAASASAGASYENLVKTYYKTTGEVESFKSKETITTDELVISPGNEVVIYENTTSGGAFSYSWDTSRKLSEEEAQPVPIEITVEYDLTPVFNEMLATIIDVNNGIGNSDSKRQNWVKYAKICVDARTKGIRHYIKEVQAQLRSDKDASDDYSWRQVKEAAQRADQTSSDAIALAIIQGGFLNITQPSHDVWAWNRIKAVSRKFLY